MRSLDVLSMVVFGGLIGGFLAGLAAVDSKEARERIYPHNIWLFLTVKSLIGAGGAIAVLLALIFAGKFNNDPTVLNQLWFFSLSLVAGFAGYRLLPAIAKRLEEQMAALERKSEEVEKRVAEVDRKAIAVEKKAEEAEEKISVTQKELSTYPKAISVAGQALAKGLTSDWKNAVDLLTPLSFQKPTDRLVHIYLGRLNRKLNRYGTAIEILSKFIEEKTKSGEGEDKDTAAAYYNRACYELQRMQQTRGDEALQLKESAYKDLETAIKLDPDSRIDARTDEDFGPIRGESKFSELTGQEFKE